ncbi:uncharacterized protein LOC117050641 isoform X3 [Lacerta agilis]|uniref:uncharacterized protein LOC117050641 isoform X3 n=1 Tax=Lacerta agilis TaxID=80427 RepID=UPI001419FA4C|nr:uncharacterized protein LOC117050641 isoform X3 [Lacerta agilis]
MEPPDTRVLLFPSEETQDPPLPNEVLTSVVPNLTPRHQDLIPTPCGPIKPWSELSSPVKIYFCVTILSLLSVIGLTIENLVQQKDEDFTVSLIQLIGVVFCIYYVSRGILQENRQELIVFVLSVALVMLRSVVNFSVLPAEQKPKLLLCLCVLLLTSIREISVLHSIFLAAGILWAGLKVVCGIIAILKELKPLAWIFLSQNLPEVAYLAYLIYTVIEEWGQGSSYALEAAVITCSCISVMIKSVLFWALFHVYHSFGQGLRERMFSSYGRIDS